MKKYPVYQKVQAHWLREIPCEWRIEKIRALFDERRSKVSDKDYPALSVGKMGVVPQLESAVKTDNGDNRKLIKAGDFAINSRSDRKGAGGISAFDGSASLIITVLQPKVELNSHYIHYLMRSHFFSEEFYRNGQGLVSDLWTTKYSSMRDIELPVPSLQEQQQIVRYLDWKTSQINHLIHGYERLISLLEERKTAVVNEAVTKGVRKGVTMKDSGVDWIGDMPAHWTLERVKQFFHIKKDVAGKEGYDVLSITQTGIKKKDISTNEGQMANDYSNYQIVNPGEYAMNHMDLLTGYIGLSPYFGVTSPDYRVFALNEGETCDTEYYLKVFQIGYRRHIFFKFGHGAASKGRWRLPAKEFLNFVIPVPPIQEQGEIVAHIADEIGKLDNVIAHISKETQLLRERRTRLISDVVTGAVDVRDIAVPEYAPEQDMEVTEDGDEYEGERA